MQKENLLELDKIDYLEILNLINSMKNKINISVDETVDSGEYLLFLDELYAKVLDKLFLVYSLENKEK